MDDRCKEPSPLVLAYIGDAVYELAVRRYLVGKGLVKVNDLHREAVRYVRADTQAMLLRVMEHKLTDDESRIARRGRNAKSGHAPRGAGVVNYRQSTGFESLVGYLYLRGEEERLREILEQAFQLVNGEAKTPDS
ncbi:MAG: ribonuclease III domain-containing protein [Bacillota bacterium]